MKHYTVTAAILTNDNQILCMQRNESKFDYISYKYEFPGGKVELNETFEDGLSRELSEEMNFFVQVEREHYFMTVDHTYPDFSITMHSYLCPVESRTFELKEHIDFVWLNKEELMTLDWAPADIPIVEKLMKEF